jgi:hypothetical protein
MFEKAMRLKLRFETNKGILSTEDLWDLSLNDLNTMAKKLNKKLKLTNEEDFLKKVTKEDEILKLSFDIVIYVLNKKLEEEEKRADQLKREAKRDKIMEILAKKQDASLESKSEADLLKELEKLEN